MFRPPPWWLRYTNPEHYIRPRMRYGLVALWLPHVGHGGQTLWDVSGNGHSGDYSGTVSGATFSVGPVVDFGGGHINLGSISALDELGDGDYTLLARYRLDTDAISEIYNSWDGGGKGVYFTATLGTGDPRIYAYNEGTNTNFIAPNNTLSAGQWYDVAFSYINATAGAMYVDGTKITCSTADVGSGNQQDDSGQTKVIGAVDTIGNRSLDGQLAFFAVYNCAHSPATIRSLSQDFWGTMFQKPVWVEIVEAAGLAGIVARIIGGGFIGPGQVG